MPMTTDFHGTTNRGQVLAIGLVAGAAVGAALGLLFAPQTGAKTRKNLARSARTIARQAGKAYESTATKVGRLAAGSARAVEQGRRVVERLVSRAPDARHFPSRTA